MRQDQILKILKIMIIATFLMFAFDLLFWEGFPISKGISSWIEGIGTESLWIGIVIWVIMFVQVTVLPIPALIVLNAAVQINLFSNSLSMFSESNFWAVMVIIISAYMLGAIFAYFLGFKFGKIAVKYCAGSDEDYEKWSSALTKKGKWWYAASVILPIFPDDILCIVAGSVKFKFSFFFWSNMVGRSVGLLTMMATLGFLGTLGNAASASFPLTSLIWFFALLALVVFYFVMRGKRYEKK